ncbi:MAG: metallophosphoesterase [Desulfomonilia bacterium]
MSVFLITIFGIYSAVHIYTFIKMRAAFSFGFVPGVALGILFAVMTFSPILIRTLEWQGYDFPARALSCIGYTWMGVLFLFFCASLLIDIYRILVSGAGFLFHRDVGPLMPSSFNAFLIPLILALGISLYGFFEAITIRPEMIHMKSSKIPESMGRVRIVQVSDVHLGLVVRGWRLQKIVKVIQETDPDILVSTGDLVDGQIDSLKGLPDVFREIQPRYGKFAVTGNHEFYAGLDHSLDIIHQAGFTMLRGEAVTIPGMITVAGVDDPTARRFHMTAGKREEDLLSSVPKDTFTLLLKHQPYLKESTLGLYDLQLSGHTHNGQIFPFSLMVRQFYDHVTGWHELGKGSHLYVSRGTGTWGPPIRFLSPPEVTVIDIIPDDDQ